MSEANIFSGVGGMSVSFLSPDLLLVGIEDEDGNQVEYDKYAFVVDLPIHHEHSRAARSGLTNPEQIR